MTIPQAFPLVQSGNVFMPQVIYYNTPTNPNNLPTKTPGPIIQPLRIPRNHKPHPKSKFTREEDDLLRQLVAKHGQNSWSRIAEQMPHRNMRQCKERWINYLSPSVCSAPWTAEEDALLEQKYREFGRKWVRIALSFPNRTDSNVKNRWLVLSRRSKKTENNILPSPSVTPSSKPLEVQIIPHQSTTTTPMPVPITNQENIPKLPEIDTFIQTMNHQKFPLLTTTNHSIYQSNTTSILLNPINSLLSNKITELIDAHEHKLLNSVPPKLRPSAQIKPS